MGGKNSADGCCGIPMMHRFCIQYTVNMAIPTGIFRILLALVILAGPLMHDGFAATVIWDVLPDRDRATVRLHQEEGFAGEVSRISRTGLVLDLGVSTSGMGQFLAPADANFFKMSEPRGRALGFFMKTPAFGFVVTRPDRNTVIIDAYSDPLGERWTPDGIAPETVPDEVPPPPLGSASAEKSLERVQGDISSAVMPGSGSGGGTVFRFRINSGGIADWDAMQAPEKAGTLSASVGDTVPDFSPPSGETSSKSSHADSVSSVKADSDQPQSLANASGKPGEKPSAPQALEKEYLDAEGKPVPPPPNPNEVLVAIRMDMAGGDYTAALEKVKMLLSHPELTKDQTEDVLHLHAEMLFMVHQGDLLKNYDAITTATLTAMNFNQESPRNSGAYLRLGYINLQVGNTVEASAYFNRLRRQYPLDENIPLTYYYWGEYYYGRNEMQQAADQFQYVISNYAESRFTRDAAIGLARSYSALEYFQEAFDIIEYIDKRWPRLYIESPPILELMGDVGYRLGRLDYALDRYMAYYNLMPNGPSADVMLTRIGDVFARKRQLVAAKTAYSRAEELFPDKDGGLVAMMRLAETGINDKPELQTMISVFQGQKNLKTVDIYKKIINEHSESELVPLAQIKLAMWYLANRRYEEALEQCTTLAERFPNHELVPRAEELAMKAFSALAAEGAVQNRPDQVLAGWQNNPLLKKQEELLPLESRVALAVSLWKRNDPDSALQMVTPMFQGAKDPRYSEEALFLALTINLDHEQWESIEKLGEKVALWGLTDKAQLQLDYALALARENLGKSEEAAPLWSRIAETGKLPEAQQAYAEYFLAKDAENTRRLQDAYLWGRSSLGRFLTMAQQDPEHVDAGKINSLRASLMDISETSGRFKEALDYAFQYMESLPSNDSQRQGLLFRIAGIYKKQGNTPEWRKTLEQLAQQYPDSVHGRAAASTLRSSQLTEDAARFAPGGNL